MVSQSSLQEFNRRCIRIKKRKAKQKEEHIHYSLGKSGSVPEYKLYREKLEGLVQDGDVRDPELSPLPIDMLSV